MADLNNKQIEGLQRLLSLLDPETLTKEDFVKAFENVVKTIKKLEDRNKQEFDAIKSFYDTLAKKMEEKTDLDIVDVNKRSMDYCIAEVEKMIKVHEAKMLDVDMKMMEVRDGKDADEERMVEEVIEKVQEPVIEKIGKSLPQLGVAVRDALELLQGEERLDKSAIKGLDELLEEIKTKAGTTVTGGIGGARTRFIDDETPSGTKDGVNTTFTLAKTPLTGSLKLYRVGARQRVTEDYTLANKTITFIIPPEAGDVLLADYRY